MDPAEGGRYENNRSVAPVLFLIAVKKGNDRAFL